MSAEEIWSIESRFYEECNKREAAAMAVLDELFTNCIVWHSATGRAIRGLGSIKQSFKEAYNTFPDSHFTIDDLVVEGDKVGSTFHVHWYT